MAVRVRRIITTVYCRESDAEMVRQELDDALSQSPYERWRPSESRIDAGEAAEAREAEQRFEEQGTGVWTSDDRAQAESQGWNLFVSDTRGLEIERDDQMAIFATDEDAVEFVVALAREGDPVAAKALGLVRRRNVVN